MAREIHIAGYYEAIASEERDRSVAFLGLPESIWEIEVQPFTPRRREWLRALKNPFVKGGSLTVGAVYQFLWCVSADFCIDSTKRDEFIAKLIEQEIDLDFEFVCEEIDDYLERAFLDAPTGGKISIPYYSGTAYLIGEMRLLYGWDMDRTLDTSFRVTYQLLRVEADRKGATLTNRRSDKCSADWLKMINSLTPEEQEDWYADANNWIER